MRGRFLIAGALIALICVAVLVSRRGAKPKISGEQTPVEQNLVAETTPTQQALRNASLKQNVVVPSSEGLSVAATVQTNSVEEQISRLEDAATQDDAESFQIVVAGLKSSSAPVRKAALDAAIQFGSRDVIPVLQELLEKTDDAREKVEMLDAIEFLKLPSLSEIRAEKRGAR